MDLAGRRPPLQNPTAPAAEQKVSTINDFHVKIAKVVPKIQSYVQNLDTAGKNRACLAREWMGVPQLEAPPLPSHIDSVGP